MHKYLSNLLGLLAVVMLMIGLTLSYKTYDKQSGDASFYNFKCENNVCDVYLTDEIDNQSFYSNLYQLLRTLPFGSVVYLHMSGNGGQVDTIFRLVNAIESSKAQVNTIIEGPVYSAHAVISMVGKHKIINQYAFLMFHSPGMYIELPKKKFKILSEKDYCKTLKGQKDRGQDMYKKCLQNVEQVDKAFYTILDKYAGKYLTKQEIKDIKDGKEVYLSSDEFNKRQEKVLQSK